jgi:dTDP-4-dehydrorhamnose reductase
VDILVIGGSGLLGPRITHRGRLAGHRVTATSHATTPPADGTDWRQFDIRRRDGVTALTAAVQPDAVINAAYRKSGWETTADGAAHVALAAAAAETAVKTIAPAAAIARTSLIIGDGAEALLELAAAPHTGICHTAGADAVSRYELGLLIAARDGLDPTTLPAGPRASSGLPGATDVRLDSTRTQARLSTRLRGAREFLAPEPTSPGVDDLS